MTAALTQLDRCPNPNCRVSLIGDPIPAEHQTHKADCAEQKARYNGRCFCRPWGDATHFRRELGVEIRDVYDGVLFWTCPDCGWAWARWTDGGRLTDQAARHVDLHNKQRQEAS